ncbi:hypothetical protein BRC83_00820 [Halobacteriales archaeon QS_1_68_17]|nr:MAG: hypothetical protein BRC83_00820 [Halobacteriales archaeon QS_1_68_17]
MIELAADGYDALLDHAEAGAPEEVCGVLGGTYGEDRSRVETVHPAENAAATPRSAYGIAPEEQLALMEAIEDAGREVVGFYHSHPAGPFEPSRTDAAQATWPGRSYVIAVLDAGHPYVGSWRWTGEEFAGERLAVRPGPAARR